MALYSLQHPVLKELGLVSRQSQNDSSSAKKITTSSIGCADILQHLLEGNVISPEQVKAAHSAMVELRNNREGSKETEALQQATREYRTRHIALRVYYEGKQYNGLAQTVGMESDNSVERQIFAALQKTHLIQSRESCGYSRCGRTDKGVSAAGQVIAMRLKSAIPLSASWDAEGTNVLDDQQLPKNSSDKVSVWVPPKIKTKKKNNKKAKLNPSSSDTTTPADTSTAPRQQREIAEYAYDKILNSVLPNDIRILGWCPVSDNFSARFSASSRTYRYFFVRRHLDLEAMRQGLESLVGTHDFRNFCKLNVVEVSNYVRKIHSAELIECDDENNGGNGKHRLCYFQIHGQAFLWHQIRCIVEIMFMIGKGLEPPNVVTELLNVKKYPGKPSYAPASEFPLVLHDCGFEKMQMGYSVTNLWTVTCQMEAQWERMMLEAARVRNCIEMLRRDVRVVRNKDVVEFAKQRLLERTKKHRKNATLSNKPEPWSAFITEINEEERALSEAMHTSTGAQDDFTSWAEAVQWLERWSLIPDPNGMRDHVHIPLLERGKGTTYEEKIQAIQQGESAKRLQRLEENAAKKRKSEGTDEEFYNHMLQQGGSAQ